MSSFVGQLANTVTPPYRAAQPVASEPHPASSATLLFCVRLFRWREFLDLNCFSVPTERDWDDRLLVNGVYYQVRPLRLDFSCPVAQLHVK